MMNLLNCILTALHVEQELLWAKAINVKKKP